MLSLAAYALEPRKQLVYVSSDDKWLKAMQTDKQDLLKWLTRAAFVWLDVYLVASAVIGYNNMKDFIEFQKWLIMVLLCFGTISVIALAIVLCVNMTPYTVSNYDEEEEGEEEEESTEAARVAVKNEIVEDFADYQEGENAEGAEEASAEEASAEDDDGVPFLETGGLETETGADTTEGEYSPSLGLRLRQRSWST